MSPRSLHRPVNVLNRFLTAETRYARRMARIARWDRPIAGRLDRARAWVNMLVVDHGIVRIVYGNLSRVTPDLWRSAQPSPGQLARFAASGGRTVLNLRGGRDHGSWPLEKEACERLGLRLGEYVLRSREAPDRATMLGLREALAELAYPVLVHCKSGADRAGLFAALFLILREGRTVAEARGQLSLRFGHFRYAKTGILDAFLDAFERDGEARGLGFEQWIEAAYDPAGLTAAFRTRPWSSLVADRLMRRE